MGKTVNNERPARFIEDLFCLWAVVCVRREWEMKQKRDRGKINVKES